MATVAFGSGAMAMNAAFEESADPGSDFRVVAQRDLTVEAGVSFLDEGGDYAGVINESGGVRYHDEGNSTFFNDSKTASTGEYHDLGDDLTISDLPAISVDSNSDGSLTIKFAILNDASTVNFENVLQLTNDGSQDEDVGVKFQQFGVDTDGSQDGNGGAVNEEDVTHAIKFQDEDGNNISTDHSVGFSDVEGQEVENTVTVPRGDTEQISMTVDLGAPGIVDDIATASSAEGNPFTAQGHDTVQLVDTVRFGVDPESTTS